MNSALCAPGITLTDRPQPSLSQPGGDRIWGSFAPNQRCINHTRMLRPINITGRRRANRLNVAKRSHLESVYVSYLDYHLISPDPHPPPTGLGPMCDT